ncbi:MAG TPA: TetR family transcriptional regulator [Streptosporangiaceae bacterium]|jgi:AcrR family transcriptional regulator|nr:TetR family transcriptional regulator [Streptosporangiaceae bacterium]
MATRAENQPAPSRLSKSVVVDRALALADTQGLDALTIRRLAQDLGVTPMALYWHFRSKEELLAGLGDRIWEEIDVNVDPDADWIPQLRGLMESLVRMLRAHPAASNLLMGGQKLHGEAAMQATEVALEVLQRGGFDAQAASEIARSALWTGLTLVMSEPGFVPRVPPEEKAEHLRQERIRLAMLPPDRFPCLVAAAGPMTDCEPEFHYRLGIDMFIGGVAALAERGPRGSSPG